MNNFKRKYWALRRKILGIFVPKFVWPKVKNIDGVTFPIRYAPYSFGTKLALVKGNYENSERKMLIGRIIEGDIVIEMGGSIGVLTSIIAKYVGNKGIVVSLEASLKITRFSKTWLEEKGNIKVLTGFGFPVFRINKNIKIIGFDEIGGSLGGRLNFKTEENKEEQMQLNAKVFDICTIMKYYGILPTILVIDIEGTEVIINKIKPNFPHTIRMILMEMHTHMYGKVIRKEIIQRIKDEGFNIIDCDHDVILFERK